MSVGNYRVDQWVVGAVAGSHQLGIYSVAAAWAEALFYLPGVLLLVQRPDIARASRQDAAVRAARVFRASLVLAAVLTVGLIAMAPVLCTVIFGSEFSEAVPMLRILALGAFGVCALELLSGALVAQRLVAAATVGVAVAAIVGLGLCGWLASTNGGLGASIAAFVGYTLGGLATTIAFAKAMRISPRALVPGPHDVRTLSGILRERLHR